MVLLDSHGISRVPRYSGTYPASRFVVAYGAVTLYGGPFQSLRLTHRLVTRRPYGLAGPTTPLCKHRGLGYVRVRSPLLAESRLISLPAGTEMVHFPALPPHAYVFSVGYPGMNQGGFPHSEISGSKPVCGSPELIAAYHVLHRLLAPRHSPYALSSLTIRTQYRAAFSWLLAVGSALFRARCPLPATRCRLHISESTACALVRNYRLQDIQLSKNPRNPVENTGLEPVTSWLQTRRSPS